MTTSPAGQRGGAYTGNAPYLMRHPERNFSHAGLVLNNRRSALKPTTAETILFIKHNADVVEAPYEVPKLSNTKNLHSKVFDMDGEEHDPETLSDY